MKSLLKPGKGLAFMVALSLMGGFVSGQTSWKKVKKESLPGDFYRYKILVERFEYLDPETLDEERDLSSYAIDKADKSKGASTGIDADVNFDYEKRDMIKTKIEETNDNLDKYNGFISNAMDTNKVSHFIVNSDVATSKDTAEFPVDKFRYVMRHKYVYYRSTTTLQGFYVPPGYNIAFYIHDRSSGKDFPYINIHSADLAYTLEKISEKMSKDK
ncbi:MAG: hypothetical protein H6585_06775 [Flavobacteriales bacterium]|nr:hypothetical protein [Flavobacteriales bacterium]MCB9448034.1 hypothetical protein [Flavobacteriales bacterium]